MAKAQKRSILDRRGAAHSTGKLAIEKHPSAVATRTIPPETRHNTENTHTRARQRASQRACCTLTKRWHHSALTPWPQHAPGHRGHMHWQLQQCTCRRVKLSPQPCRLQGMRRLPLGAPFAQAPRLYLGAHTQEGTRWSGHTHDYATGMPLRPLRPSNWFDMSMSRSRSRSSDASAAPRSLKSSNSSSLNVSWMSLPKA